MNAIILSVGQELISGQTVDTNSSFLSRRLAQRGIATLEHWTVGDTLEPIVAAIGRACRQADMVLITGGIGPTADDLTRQALAAAMGSELEMNLKCLAELEEFFSKRNRPMVPANRIQAMIPRGAKPLANRMGTAPGIAGEIAGVPVYVMPGVPSEMKVMYDEVIAPLLPAGQGVLLHRILHTFGQGESDVATRIEDLMDRSANPLVGTTVAAGMVSIRIITRAADAAEAQRMSDAMAHEIRSRLGDLVIGDEDATVASVTGKLLRDRQGTLSTAESCTGGMVGELITSVPGASDYYLGGVVSYHNKLKEQFLGVGSRTLAEHGAVSEDTAREMAQGVRARTGSDWALSITGIAGPDGGSDPKPVGLVFIGLAGPGGTEVHRVIFPGTRDIIRLRASLAALNFLRLALIRFQSP